MVLLEWIWMDVNVCVVVVYYNDSSATCQLFRYIKSIATLSYFLGWIHKIHILILGMLAIRSYLVQIFLLVYIHLWKLLIDLINWNGSLIRSNSSMITTLCCWWQSACIFFDLLHSVISSCSWNLSRKSLTLLQWIITCGNLCILFSNRIL